MSDAEIGAALLKAGWPSEDVQRALAASSSGMRSAGGPRKRSALAVLIIAGAVVIVGGAGYLIMRGLPIGTVPFLGEDSEEKALCVRTGGAYRKTCECPPGLVFGSQGCAPQPVFEVGTERIIHGVVRSSVNNDAPGSGVSYLVIDMDGREVRVQYHTGEEECINAGAGASGARVKSGQQVSVFGLAISGIELSTCRSASYFIRVDADTTSSSIDVAPSERIVTIQTDGGLCEYGGCFARISIFKDGRWEYASGGGVNKSGAFNQDRIMQLAALIDATDFALVRKRPFIETCPTAYDGQENTYTFHSKQGDETVSDCVVDLTSVPLIATVRGSMVDIYNSP